MINISITYGNFVTKFWPLFSLTELYTLRRFSCREWNTLKKSFLSKKLLLLHFIFNKEIHNNFSYSATSVDDVSLWCLQHSRQPVVGFHTTYFAFFLFYQIINNEIFTLPIILIWCWIPLDWILVPDKIIVA